MIMKIRLLSVVIILGMVCVSMAELVKPQGAIAGSWYDSGSAGKETQRAPTHMIDGTGLVFTGAIGEEHDYTKYQIAPCINEHGVYTCWTGYAADKNIDKLWAIIDLGQIYELDAINIFNFNPLLNGVNTDRETQSLDIWVREDSGFSNSNLDGVQFSTNGWTLLTINNNMTLTQYSGGSNESAAGVLSGLQGIKGRYVALDINSSYGNAIYSLIDEVQVFGSLSISESQLLNPVNAYSNFEAGDRREAINLINGSGLLFTGAPGEEGDYTKYEYDFCFDTYGYDTEWFGLRIETTTTPDDMWVIIDLGAVCELNALNIFNFNPPVSSTAVRGAKDIDLWVREDMDFNNTRTNGVPFNTNGWTLVTVNSDLRLYQNPGGTTQQVSNVIALNGINARMVAIDVNSSYAYASGVGLGEVQLYGSLNLTNSVRVVPTSAIAYDELVFNEQPTTRGAINTINGTGLDFIGEPGQEGDYSKYQYLPGLGIFGENHAWSSTTVSGHKANDMWLIYDLGDIRNLDALSIFNFNPATGEVVERSVRSLNVWIRDDSAFSNSHLDQTTFNSSDWTLVARDMFLLQNPGGSTQSCHNVLGFTDVSGRYVALDINKNYQPADVNHTVALGEVLFFCEPPPPPSGNVFYDSLIKLHHTFAQVRG